MASLGSINSVDLLGRRNELLQKLTDCYSSVKSTDVLFIVDSSQFISSFDYKFYIKSYLEGVARRANFSIAGLQMGVVLFGQQAMLGIGLGRATDSNKESILRQLDSLPQINDNSRNLADALYQSATSALPTRKSREKHLVAVVITSGSDQQITPSSTNSQVYSISEAAQTLKQFVDEVFCIFNNATAGSSLASLRSIASSNKHLFELSKWSELSIERANILLHLSRCNLDCLPSIKPISNEISMQPLNKAKDSRLLLLELKLADSLKNLSISQGLLTQSLQNQTFYRKKFYEIQVRILELKKQNSLILELLRKSKLEQLHLVKSNSQSADRIVKLELEKNRLQGQLDDARSSLVRLTNYNSNIGPSNSMKSLKAQVKSKIDNLYDFSNGHANLNETLKNLEVRVNETHNVIKAQTIQLGACKLRLNQLEGQLQRNQMNVLHQPASPRSDLFLWQAMSVRLRKEKSNLNRLIDSLQVLFTARIKQLTRSLADSKTALINSQKLYTHLHQQLTSCLNKANYLKDLMQTRDIELSRFQSLNKRDSQNLTVLKHTIYGLQQQVLVQQNITKHLQNSLQRRGRVGNFNFTELLGHLNFVRQDAVAQFVQSDLMLPLFVFSNSGNSQAYNNSLFANFFGFSRISLVLYDDSDVVGYSNANVLTRIVFDARNATPDNWFQQENLLDSYPWPFDNLKLDKSLRFIHKRMVDPDGYLNMHFEISAENASCNSSYSVYLLVSISTRPGGLINNTIACGQNKTFVMIYSKKLDGSQLDLLESNMTSQLGRVNKFSIEASLLLFDENSPALQYPLIFAFSSKVPYPVSTIYNSRMSSPPDWRPVVMNYFKGDLSKNVSSEGQTKSIYTSSNCNCWYRSPIMRRWTEGAKIWNQIHFDLVRDDGSVGVSLIFAAKQSTQFNWFSQTRLTYSHPWNLEMLRLYQFTRFGIDTFDGEDDSGISFAMEVVGDGAVGGISSSSIRSTINNPTDSFLPIDQFNSSSSCQLRLAYMYVLERRGKVASNCVPSIKGKAITNGNLIYAVTSDTGIPGKLSEMEMFDQINIWVD